MLPTGSNSINIVQNIFSIKYFFSKCGQIRTKMGIWLLLLEKFLIMLNFIVSALKDHKK